MKCRLLVVLALMLLGVCGAASAQGVAYLYVDAAPNVYGSPDYAAWQAKAFAGAAAGTFVNMAGSAIGCNAASTRFEIEDEVVYSFGDLGKRLTWIYWIPGETKASLAGRFKTALFNTWDGDVLDFYLDQFASTWLEPTKWVDYDADGDGNVDGVVGTAGMAWWGAYGVNTPEALEADLAEWGMARESWEFKAELDGTEFSLVSDRVPVRLMTLYAACSAGAPPLGKFVSCVAKQTNALQKAKTITGKEKGFIQACAAQTK
jgi:hypothetical protein